MLLLLLLVLVEPRKPFSICCVSHASTNLMLQHEDVVNYVLVETTGMADPAPIIQVATATLLSVPSLSVPSLSVPPPPPSAPSQWNLFSPALIYRRYGTWLIEEHDS